MTTTDFKVADLSADFGRKEIQLAEHEMPGLMAMRANSAKASCLRAPGLLAHYHDDPDRGPDRDADCPRGAVRWVSATSFQRRTMLRSGRCLPQRHPQTPGRPVYAGRRDVEEYWWCTDRSRVATGRQRVNGSEHDSDDGGDATMLVHKGWSTKKPSHPDPRVHHRKSLRSSWHCVKVAGRRPEPLDADRCRNQGGTEETTTGAHRLYEMLREGSLLFSDQRVNDAQEQVLQSTAVAIHQLTASIGPPMPWRKVAVVCGCGDVGKGCAESPRRPRCPRDRY